MARTVMRPAHGAGRTANDIDARPQAMVLLAGLGAMVGPFLPWLTVQDLVSQRGIDFDSGSAWAAVVIGVIVSSAAAYNLIGKRIAGFGEVLAGMALALALGGIVIHGFDLVGQIVGGGAGVGLYVLLAAVCVLALGALWHAFVIGRGALALCIGGGVLGVLMVASVILALVPASGGRQFPASGANPPALQAPVAVTAVSSTDGAGGAHP